MKPWLHALHVATLLVLFMLKKCKFLCHSDLHTTLALVPVVRVSAGLYMNLYSTYGEGLVQWARYQVPGTRYQDTKYLVKGWARYQVRSIQYLWGWVPGKKYTVKNWARSHLW